MSSQYGTLLGVALGALIVGTTLTVYDALSDSASAQVSAVMT